MSLQPEALMRTWFEQVWNQKREDAIDRLFAPGGVAHGLPGGSLRGPASFRPLFNAFHGAFGNLHIEIERTVTEGEFVTAHCRVTGTHTGDTLGFPATGKNVNFEGITIGRVADGQFQEGWNVFDFLTMYQQLGVVTLPDTDAARR
jgi:steroid delta-isomerase-like uncharacterized protein